MLRLGAVVLGALVAPLGAAGGLEKEEDDEALLSEHRSGNAVSQPVNAFNIGDKFEGTASDWAECVPLCTRRRAAKKDKIIVDSRYVVWSVGVLALIFFLSGVVKINVHEPLTEDATIVDFDDATADDEKEATADAKKAAPLLTKKKKKKAA